MLPPPRTSGGPAEARAPCPRSWMFTRRFSGRHSSTPVRSSCCICSSCLPRRTVCRPDPGGVAMRANSALILSVLLLGGCANPAPPTTPAADTQSTAPLLDTHWKLTQLGEQQITPPPDARPIHVVLHAEN